MEQPTPWTAQKVEAEDFSALVDALNTNPTFQCAVAQARDLYRVEEAVERAQRTGYSCYITLAEEAIRDFKGKWITA